MARSDVANFKPRPAVVTAVRDAAQQIVEQWRAQRPNDPVWPQWITADAGANPADGATYVFRSTFDMTTGSVTLGGFVGAVDGYVKSIRLNGKDASGADDKLHPRSDDPGRLAITGFVEGTNTLEVVVVGGMPDGSPSGEGPVSLLVTLEGATFPREHAGAATSARGLRRPCAAERRPANRRLLTDR